MSIFTPKSHLAEAMIEGMVARIKENLRDHTFSKGSNPKYKKQSMERSNNSRSILRATCGRTLGKTCGS